MKIKIEKSLNGSPKFKLSASKYEIDKYRVLNNIRYFSKKKSGLYNYEIPMKFFVPIFNNVKKEDLYIDTRSSLSFLEFSDEEEGDFYYSIEATPKYMRTWREYSCPNIYKITIKEDLTLEKRIAFSKIIR